ncbi:MAG TPA: metal-dependent transcriptional regulator [Ktedonobacteraceae bacterium]|nr:metal-dependent transcriptional regulator [Ktedonobacteraceae bacterium]
MKTEELLSPTVEEYLETIYNISMEGEPVIGARLAQKFGVAPPTVTEMLKRLVRDGFVEMDARRQVTLTESGIQAAEAVLRRHRLTERFLVDMLGMQWHQVHEEACRLEHFISGAVEARVITSLNNPTTCPHGNPIPGQVPDARNYLKDHHAVRLSSIPIGGQATILCISEVVEDEEGLILYLHEKGLTPETRLTVLAHDDTGEQDETFKVEASGRAVCISKVAADKIWVTR